MSAERPKENGHFCSDASPAKDLSGNVITMSSSKQRGECPQCPPPIEQVNLGDDMEGVGRVKGRSARGWRKAMPAM
jgi:hypothetical protein